MNNNERTVYLNGELVLESQAKISIFDRAVLFGDALYEVAGVTHGKLIDFDNHMLRYQRNLDSLNIPEPLAPDKIRALFKELISLNNIVDGLVYMQISRGVADRDYVYDENMQPTVFMFTQRLTEGEKNAASEGIKLVSVPDIRWARRDIKTVNLLGQVLAKQEAHSSGGNEALMIDPEGFVTECGSSSFFIVKENKVLTRRLNRDILPGVTRKALIRLCEEQKIDLVESRFDLATALDADEAFITAASIYLMPVNQIDDQKIGDSVPGPVTRKLLEIYSAYVEETLT
ncbi:MAG: D-alanine transaminase [Gammaproteobacteria bacterium]|jgi:D-alanine transaminase